MVTNPQSNEDQKNLNERLRSLKIDRAPAPSTANKNRSPKLLLVGIAAVVALAAFAYLFLFSGTKTISAATVRVESAGAGGSQDEPLEGPAVLVEAIRLREVHLGALADARPPQPQPVGVGIGLVPRRDSHSKAKWNARSTS